MTIALLLLSTLVAVSLVALHDGRRNRRPQPLPVRHDERPVRLILAAWQGEQRPGERRFPER